MCSIALFELLLFGGDKNWAAATPHIIGEIWVPPDEW